MWKTLKREGDGEQSDLGWWWEGRCVLAEVQHSYVPFLTATGLGSELLEDSLDGMLPCIGNQFQGVSGI